MVLPSLESSNPTSVSPSTMSQPLTLETQQPPLDGLSGSIGKRWSNMFRVGSDSGNESVGTLDRKRRFVFYM